MADRARVLAPRSVTYCRDQPDGDHSVIGAQFTAPEPIDGDMRKGVGLARVLLDFEHLDTFHPKKLRKEDAKVLKFVV